MHYHSMVEDGDEIPEPSNSLSLEDTDGTIIVPVTIYPELYAEEYRNRRIKTNTTIPAWLKADAEKLGLNFQSSSGRSSFKNRQGSLVPN